MPGDTGVDGGDGTVICCCWASTLPDSKANPSAAIADNLIMFIVLLPYVGGAQPHQRRRATDSVSNSINRSTQEAGGSNSLLTGGGSVWRRHSTNSSTRATLETKDAKPAPAISTNSRPPKFRKQITVAIEHSQMAIKDTQ
jgi:hypothetical protein